MSSKEVEKVREIDNEFDNEDDTEDKIREIIAKSGKQDNISFLHLLQHLKLRQSRCLVKLERVENQKHFITIQ